MDLTSAGIIIISMGAFGLLCVMAMFLFSAPKDDQAMKMRLWMLAFSVLMIITGVIASIVGGTQ